MPHERVFGVGPHIPRIGANAGSWLRIKVLTSKLCWSG